MTDRNPCSYVLARHSLPNGEAGEGDHDWWQVGGEIWCLECGADYDDHSKTHPMFKAKPAPGQMPLFAEAA